MKWAPLYRLTCDTARVGDTIELWGTQESAICACGQLTQLLQHVGVDSVIHTVRNGFAGLRRLDAATRTWLK